MFVCCWAAKGGSGTTVVACALAVLAARAEGSALLVDLAGDAPSALGLPVPTGPGVLDWLAADVGVEALPRLEIDGPEGLRVLPTGVEGPAPSPIRVAQLGSSLARSGRSVVVDCGTSPPPWAQGVLEHATTSLLVTRACYLSLRRAVAAPRPSAVVLVEEAGRALQAADVEHALGVPVVAVVVADPAVARAVDAGLLAVRLPRPLARALRHVA